MPTSKRERELARRRLERQAERRAARRQRRRQRTAIGGSVVAVLALISAVVYFFTPIGVGGTATAASSPSSTTSASPSAASGRCTYAKAGTATKSVGIPPAVPTQTTGTEDAIITTNRGTISVSLLADKAPCTVNSFTYLASKGYFANTPCHRLTTSGIYVLQCGDPSGTGGGGPGYQFGEENLGAFGSGQSVTYPAGTVAMANAGKGTNGSQFFLVYKDSPLAPSYTPFGKITSGLDVLQAIAKAGVAGGGSDGKPKEPVTITKVTLRAASSRLSVAPTTSAGTGASTGSTGGTGVSTGSTGGTGVSTGAPAK